MYDLMISEDDSEKITVNDQDEVCFHYSRLPFHGELNPDTYPFKIQLFPFQLYRRNSRGWDPEYFHRDGFSWKRLRQLANAFRIKAIDSRVSMNGEAYVLVDRVDETQPIKLFPAQHYTDTASAIDGVLDARIPRPIEALLAPFEDTVPLLDYAQYPNYLELLQSNPGLGYALAQTHYLEGGCGRDRHHQEVQTLLSSRREYIAQAAGFWNFAINPVRFLSKVSASALTYSRFARLQLSWSSLTCMNPENETFLRHVPHIDANLLELLVCEPYLLKHMTLGLAQEIASVYGSQGADTPGYDLFSGTVRGLMNLGITPNRLANLKQLNDAYERLCSMSGFNDCLKQFIFPAPPRPSFSTPSLTVQALSRATVLQNEGRDVRNCLSGGKALDYAEKIQAGDLYVYSVKGPEYRGTLSLYRVRNRWFIDELKALSPRMTLTEEQQLLIRRWSMGGHPFHRMKSSLMAAKY